MAHLPAALALTLAALGFMASTVISPPWDIVATLVAAVGIVAALLLFAIRRAQAR